MNIYPFPSRSANSFYLYPLQASFNVPSSIPLQSSFVNNTAAQYLEYGERYCMNGDYYNGLSSYKMGWEASLHEGKASFSIIIARKLSKLYLSSKELEWSLWWLQQAKDLSGKFRNISSDLSKIDDLLESELNELLTYSSYNFVSNNDFEIKDEKEEQDGEEEEVEHANFKEFDMFAAAHRHQQGIYSDSEEGEESNSVIFVSNLSGGFDYSVEVEEDYTHREGDYLPMSEDHVLEFSNEIYPNVSKEMLEGKKNEGEEEEIENIKLIEDEEKEIDRDGENLEKDSNMPPLVDQNNLKKKKKKASTTNKPKPKSARAHDPDNALRFSAKKGKEEDCLYWISVGANVNSRDERTGYSALHQAAWNGKIGVVGLLINAGADIFLKNNDGETAIESARAGAHDDIVTFLMEHSGGGNIIKSDNVNIKSICTEAETIIFLDEEKEVNKMQEDETDISKLLAAISQKRTLIDDVKKIVYLSKSKIEELIDSSTVKDSLVEINSNIDSGDKSLYGLLKGSISKDVINVNDFIVREGCKSCNSLISMLEKENDGSVIGWFSTNYGLGPTLSPSVCEYITTEEFHAKLFSGEGRASEAVKIHMSLDVTKGCSLGAFLISPEIEFFYIKKKEDDVQIEKLNFSFV